jgi:uncharacterized membrane protein
MMWGYEDGSAWFWMVPMMLLFWGSFIALVIFAWRAFIGPRSGGDQAMAALRQRLAAGQISQEEFDQTKRILHG